MTFSEQRGRALVYARSGGTCEVCGRSAATVHHRVKRGQGGTWAPSNLLHLCGDGTRFCHGWIEANPTHAQTLGLWLPSYADPATSPAYLRPPSLLIRDWWAPDDTGCWTFHLPPDLPPEQLDAAQHSLYVHRLTEAPTGPLRAR